MNGGASSTGYRIAAQNNGTNVFRVGPSGNLLVDVLGGSDAALVVNHGGSGPAALFNNGNVGIGTVSPVAKLDVAGNVNITGNLAVSGTFSASGYTASSGTVTGGASGLTLNAGGTNQNVTIAPSGTGATVINGNVGVGTANPDSLLHIQPSSAANTALHIKSGNDSNFTRILMGRGSDSVSIAISASTGQFTQFDTAGDLVIRNSANDIHFSTDGGATTQMTLLNGGNVGIGTVSPGAKLDVAGNANITGNLTVTGTFSAPNYSATGGAITGGATGLTLNAGGTNQNVTISPSGGYALINGNVGIGTTNPPIAKVHISDGFASATSELLSLQTAYSPISAQKSITWRDAASIVGQIDTRYDGNTVDMVFGHLYNSGYNSTDRMVIKGNGNVGIGTTNPGDYKLAVNGTIHAKEVVVDQNGWADVVFDESYRNAPLSEVEQHIREHRHLPGVPSARDVAEKGVNVGQMQAVLLQKIEELTLHVIEQEKRIQKLEAENAVLRGQ